MSIEGPVEGGPPVLISPGPPAIMITVACRDAARTRLAVAAGAIFLAIVGLAIGWRRLDPDAAPRVRERPLPYAAAMWGKRVTTAGFIFTAAAIVFGVWLQFALPDLSEQRTYFRLTTAIESLIPVGVGLLVIAVGRILELREPTQELLPDPAPPEFPAAWEE